MEGSGREPGLHWTRCRPRAPSKKERKLWANVVRKLRTGEMPPSRSPQPTRAERERLANWIETQLVKVDCGLKRDPGRVTVRRLNRAEYNNTIRDLVGVDFKPAKDFPADDVGYGFDNVGDVLSLPPILMEKYLEAAEKIADAAILTPEEQTSKPRIIPAKTLVGGSPVGKFRGLFSAGKVSTAFNSPSDGEYILRVQAYAQQAGPESARMQVEIDGKPVKVFQVEAVEGDETDYELKLRLAKGRHTIAAAFINDYFNPKDPNPRNRDRNLFVGDISVQGPIGGEPKPVPASHRQLVICQPGKGMSPDECARRILSRFASRAYRRPATKEEVEQLVNLVRLARKNGDSFEAGLELAVTAVLVSPKFLFRIEEDPRPDDPNVVRLINEFELATRLSYFLWSSMPDERLFDLARPEGELRKNLDAEVRRMLRDPKVQALVDNFAGQWLQIRNLSKASPNPDQFPSFNDALRQDMAQETKLFFATILKEDRSILDFIDADFTFVNERLARHYGMKGIRGEEFRRVKVDRAQRGGVLTMATVLTVTSNPTRTSPVKRGKWILENILGTPPPPPPPEVEELDESKNAVEAGSLRKRMELHRSKPICASCHERMDPLGFGFENYDAIGAWRNKDGPFPIDASGTLPDGQKFNGPAELKAILKMRKKDFARCLSEKMLTYALGRGLEYYDKCAIDEIVARLVKNEYRFSALILAVVHSDPFQKTARQRGRTCLDQWCFGSNRSQ
ncbi:MAG: filamin [Gemmatales bacterium]|nr:MAG: filamin [Gemmatales bacterium]